MRINKQCAVQAMESVVGTERLHTPLATMHRMFYNQTVNAEEDVQ